MVGWSTKVSIFRREIGKVLNDTCLMCKRPCIGCVGQDLVSVISCRPGSPAAPSSDARSIEQGGSGIPYLLALSQSPTQKNSPIGAFSGGAVASETWYSLVSPAEVSAAGCILVGTEIG